MSRRTGRGDFAFGSDSFLDILANIVGILIILIVVAGMRVSQAPVPAPADDRRTASSSASDATDAREAPEKKAAPPKPRTVTTDTADVPPVRQLDSEHFDRLRRLEAELREMDRKLAGRQSGLRRARARMKRLKRELDQTSKAVAAASAETQQDRHKLASLREDVEELRQEHRRLQARLETAQNEEPPVETIRHRVTPVSHLVEGEEVHFRLENNRVAHVPIEELLDRLRAQVRQRKQVLANMRQRRGEVGPVDGFTMQYVMQRRPLSVMEELRHGRGMVRIVLSQWRVDPEPYLQPETAEEALSRGSKFVRILAQTDPETTLTFWVYPDSFGLYRRLQKVARQQGFTVAARPLPFGVPIAGSPDGTRSAGQ